MLSCSALKRWRWLILFGFAAAPFGACGPDRRPEEPCEGPSFNLVVKAEAGPLPADTRINVRYGGNPDGEPYQLSKPRTPQAVKCVEDTSPGGAPSDDAASALAGAGGASAPDDATVWSLRCALFTQGPARLDVTATGYEPIEDTELSFERKRHCEVDEKFVLVPLKPDAGI